MTLAEIKQRVYFLTGSDVNSYPDSHFLISLNIWNDKITGMIIRKGGTWKYDDSNHDTLQILSRDLEADERNYLLPIEMKNLFSVRVSYDGENWVKLSKFDTNLMNKGVYDDTGFTINNAKYDITGNVISLYPKPTQDIRNGLEISISRDAYKFTSTDLTEGTKSPGFDREFHDMLATGVAWEWAKKSKKEIANDLFGDLQNYYNELGLNYSDKNKDEIINLKPSYINYN